MCPRVVRCDRAFERQRFSGLDRARRDFGGEDVFHALVQHRGLQQGALHLPTWRGADKHDGSVVITRYRVLFTGDLRREAIDAAGARAHLGDRGEAVLVDGARRAA